MGRRRSGSSFQQRAPLFERRVRLPAGTLIALITEGGIEVEEITIGRVEIISGDQHHEIGTAATTRGEQRIQENGLVTSCIKIVGESCAASETEDRRRARVTRSGAVSG